MTYNIKLLDCTFRDGGYYNAWDFDSSLIQIYLQAMEEISVDFVEMGFRGFSKEGFKGPCAYTTDNFVRGFEVPNSLKIGVMVNASELIKHPKGVEIALSELFVPASDSPISLVRIACHVHEIEFVMQGLYWLKENGYMTAINFMQIADRNMEEISNIAKMISDYPLDVLYVADSMGSMSSDQTTLIINTLRRHWTGELGIHTHNNMGQALSNSMRAIEEGVTWIDGTVTGMGRGPGNAQTEYLAIELASLKDKPCSITKLMRLINKFFKPMQHKFGWGPNVYYYLAGKYSIHPTFIQEMLNDSRFDIEDALSVIEHLKVNGGKKYSTKAIESARKFYEGEPCGHWYPSEMIEGKEVLILGAGHGVIKHKKALEEYLRIKSPFVIALNTLSSIEADLIDIRAACHPMRLFADCSVYALFKHPLAIPASMLPQTILSALKDKELLDFGIEIKEDTFRFEPSYCVVPKALVIAYTLAIATSGHANRILLAGFDGFGADDPRSKEMIRLLNLYQKSPEAVPLLAITPTQYEIEKTSVYRMIAGY